MRRKPHFIIIGAMKCATSTLHEQLAAQPGFHMSTPKEPNFFSDDDQFARGLDWYFDLFANARPDDLCGESSTHYTKLPTHPNAVTRIQQALGTDLKLIYVMRDPIARVVSQYIHEWSTASVSVPVDQAIDVLPRIVDYSRYAMQLEPYLRAFGPERVLPVFYERLTARSQDELARVTAFLGYQGVPSWSSDVGNENVSRDRMRADPLRDAIVNFPPLAWLRRRLVPQPVRDRIKSLWMMRNRPRLSPAKRAAVVAQLDPDLARLGDWLGMPLSCDTFKAQALSATALQWKASAPRPVSGA